MPWVRLEKSGKGFQIFSREINGCSGKIHVQDKRMCDSNKVAGQQTCDRPVHVPHFQASHFGEKKEQKLYIIDCTLPAAVAE